MLLLCLSDVRMFDVFMIDFNIAFDLVDHPILLGKLESLGLPDRANNNWIISYLTGRTQVVKCDGSVSSAAEINTSIIQGYGIGSCYMLLWKVTCALCLL